MFSRGAGFTEVGILRIMSRKCFSRYSSTVDVTDADSREIHICLQLMDPSFKSVTDDSFSDTNLRKRNSTVNFIRFGLYEICWMFTFGSAVKEGPLLLPRWMGYELSFTFCKDPPTSTLVSTDGVAVIRYLFRKYDPSQRTTVSQSHRHVFRPTDGGDRSWREKK